MTKVVHYFDQQATSYDNDSGRGVWRFLRTMESSKVEKLIQKVQFSQALDLGSGSGYYTRILRKYTDQEITVVDASKKMLNSITLSKVKTVHSRIEDFKAEKSYEFITAIGVMEFMDRPSDLFMVAHKSLVQGGYLLVLFPKRKFLSYLYALFHRTHQVRVNLFKTKGVIAEAKKNGFNVLQIENAFPFSSVILFAKGRQGAIL